MAEFDNGIPPVGTDVTNESISAILLTKEVYVEDVEEKQISSILLEKTEFIDDTEIRQINSILMSKEPTNRILYCSFL